MTKPTTDWMDDAFEEAAAKTASTELPKLNTKKIDWDDPAGWEPDEDDEDEEDDE